jgi:hypothetical protein
MGGAGRRHQHDRRRRRIDGFTELRQRNVVDAAALERNRTAEVRRLDRNPRRRGKGFLAALGGFERGGRSHLAGLSRHRRRTGRRQRSLLRRLGLLLGLLLRRRRRLALGLRNEIHPEGQHQGRQYEGEDGIVLLVQIFHEPAQTL